MLMKKIKENRQQINKDLSDPDQRKFFSPATYAGYQITIEAILEYAHGKLIDLGCGDTPLKKIIESKVSEYDTLDVEQRTENVKFISDIQDMGVVESGTYDTAVCLEVLEHVRNPSRALDEINRILKDNGYLILSVPHLSRLHEVPHDYYRYTKYALNYLLQESGFEVLSIKDRGGMCSFIGHQVSTFFLCSTWHIPVVRQIMFFLNKFLSVKLCLFLDRLFDKDKIFALGYTVCAQKKIHK